MNREKTTSMLYCTGAYLAFISWFCSTQAISSVAMPVSEYVGYTQPELLLLATAGRH